MTKRLLCILSSLNVGGAETFVMKVCRQLPPEQYQIDFVVSEENGYYTEEVLARGGRIYFVPMRTKDLSGAFRRIRRIVRENGYSSVLKLGDSPIQVVDLIAAKLGGAKRLVMRSCNALNRNAKQKLLDGLLRPVLNAVANVKIAPSGLAAAYTFGQKQLDRGKVVLLNNAVDLKVFCYDPVGRESIRRELGLENRLVIGHVGRFTKQKNHSFLLEIFSSIRQKDDRAVLMLVGTGELEADIRKKAEALGLLEHIVFTGVRSDVPQLLSAMDVFAFPSFHEGMPNTVIEAQATGLGCVIADTITREADITGLVEYLPLSLSADAWADKVLEKAALERRDTHEDFRANRYDIESTAEHFCKLCFGE